MTKNVFAIAWVDKDGNVLDPISQARMEYEAEKIKAEIDVFADKCRRYLRDAPFLTESK